MRRLGAVPFSLALAALVGLSTLLRFWAGSLVPIPWIAPDELIYAELGRSLYANGAFELLDRPTAFFSFVTPALVGLPLSLPDVELGYTLLKALQALVMSLAAVPVALWARSLGLRGWALVAAALTLAVPGLAYSGLIMTEVAFYPALVLAAWAIARAVATPTPAAQALAIAAVALATATRLQAAALVAAYAAAAVAVAVWERRGRDLVAYWPSLLGVAIAAGLWGAWQLREGAPATQLLGAYRAAGEVDYALGDALRFVAYHLGDLVLFTGLVPVCAVALLPWARLDTREARAFLATVVAVAAAMVGVVGVFASRHVGHLAERNLFALAPLFFLGLALWLHRGAPRPRVPTAIAALAALVLLFALPVDRFVSLDTIPDAFTVIPLYRLGVRAPSVDLELVVAFAGAAAAAAFALLPAGRLPLLVGALLLAFAGASVSTSRVVAAQATLTKPGTVGANARWVDDAGDGRAAYLYTGDVYWNSVWETVFWNRRVRRVYDLLEAHVPGGIPQVSLGPYEDGRLVDKFGRTPVVRHVVASDSLRFEGNRVADAGNGIALWRVEQPFRLVQWTQNVRFDATVERHGRLVRYACTGGRLVLRLRALAATRVAVRSGETTVGVRRLRPGERWSATVAGRPTAPGGRGLCSFDVMTSQRIAVERFDFEHAGS